MQVLKDQAKDTIEALVVRFEEQIDSYTHSDYNETQTRRDFIDPFFKALGWDVDNQNGYAEAYREVIHEDKIKIGDATKAPDYSFRLAGGKRLFFVEAKKPSVAVKDDILPAYQIRRYGWSAKLPISIITDFREFAIYDCTKKPNPTDKASVARIKYFTFQDYLNEFDFLWETFSKERVLKGSFDKFIISDNNKKGTTTVDKEFLSSLDTWRTDLAVNISKLNQQLNEDELNFVVQQTIDRIIFLRIAEDRHIEPYGALRDSLKQGNYFKNMFDLFRQADEKYNSGLFDLKKDKISKSLVVDNKILKKIINELYYPESPYEFSVLSVEILGSAYEQFLGKTILIDKSHRAKIEEKPEVRKAGGVYYTPQYIVDYIVQNTVGKLIEGKTPKELEKIKIADPACGSGSFLIGAYQYLMDYHKNYYTEAKTKIGKKDSPITPEGNLTSNEKKRILLNNIFGVDIDTNAVEVTKLSLLLKCMEGESGNSIAQQYKLWHERILPTLDDNIKSGNSLVDTDFYDTELDFGEDRKVKPFNWESAFPAVFEKGGFDAVIGNPPYIQAKTGQLNDNELNYFIRHYNTAEYQLNTYGLFLERGFNILNQFGRLGFIIPNYWLSTQYDKKLRKYLFQVNHVLELTNVFKIFESAVVDTLIIIAKKKTNNETLPTIVRAIDRNIKSVNERLIKFKKQEWAYNKVFIPNQTDDDITLSFRDPINLCASNQLKDYFILKFGAKLYEVGKGTPPQKSNFSKESKYQSKSQIDDKYKKLLRARDIKHYFMQWENDWVKYGMNLAAPRSIEIFQGDRILINRIVSKKYLESVSIKEEFICNTDVITLKPISDNIICNFFLGILNSNLCIAYIKSNNVNLDRAAFPKINTNTLETLPVPDYTNVDLDIRNEIIYHVETLLRLNEEKQAATLQTQVEQLESRVKHHEEKINCSVYQLYGLTEDEINVVEEAINK
jgi:type I restriction-modification system DNA methylase subunit